MKKKLKVFFKKKHVPKVLIKTKFEYIIHCIPNKKKKIMKSKM